MGRRKSEEQAERNKTRQTQTWREEREKGKEMETNIVLCRVDKKTSRQVSTTAQNRERTQKKLREEAPVSNDPKESAADRQRKDTEEVERRKNPQSKRCKQKREAEERVAKVFIIILVSQELTHNEKDKRQKETNFEQNDTMPSQRALHEGGPALLQKRERALRQEKEKLEKTVANQTHFLLRSAQPGSISAEDKTAFVRHTTYYCPCPLVQDARFCAII